ncbi:TraI domain-containing protein [Paraburkholderia silvatlantica]|uniref:Putative helicase n=1 Tax=Paraburkholderia silvatlantica TaxID=321895 RepID=A0A2V4SXL2_9BURK|nr:putative helicase [Paraburkholderia silvatlantica]TDR04873.1 putative helicase [Paraburkholderia silvatlantica]
MLLQRLVPSASLGWLAQYPPVLDELAAYLSDDAAAKEGALAKIVGEADRRSVAQNLLTGPRTRLVTARSVPLIERLMGGLRRLLAEDEMPLNRAGATGYCDGESLWCVAKTLAETVRAHLGSNEQQQPGAGGIPSDNNRLFDTWQEYGALMLTPDGSAIWVIVVTVGTWKRTFTVLRFPLDRLHADPARYPRALPPGAVRVVEAGKDEFRALATRQATGSGAIYWHIAHRNGLLATATGDVLARALAKGAREEEPRAAIRAIALAVFDAIDAPPWCRRSTCPRTMAFRGWRDPRTHRRMTSHRCARRAHSQAERPCR